MEWSDSLGWEDQAPQREGSSCKIHFPSKSAHCEELVSQVTIWCGSRRKTHRVHSLGTVATHNCFVSCLVHECRKTIPCRPFPLVPPANTNDKCSCLRFPHTLSRSLTIWCGSGRPSDPLSLSGCYYCISAGYLNNNTSPSTVITFITPSLILNTSVPLASTGRDWPHTTGAFPRSFS